MLCGFEGYMIAMKSSFPLTERQAIANSWLSVMMARFKGSPRPDTDSEYEIQAKRMAQAWKAKDGDVNVRDMLLDIETLIGLFSPEKAKEYREFWG